MFTHHLREIIVAIIFLITISFIVIVLLLLTIIVVVVGLVEYFQLMFFVYSIPVQNV